MTDKISDLELHEMIQDLIYLDTGTPEEIAAAKLERQEFALWANICRLAKTDPVLNDMLEHVIVYYKLKA
jgi:hypothetical protein